MLSAFDAKNLKNNLTFGSNVSSPPYKDMLVIFSNLPYHSSDLPHIAVSPQRFAIPVASKFLLAYPSIKLPNYCHRSLLIA